MKEFFCRVLRYSFCCLLLGFLFVDNVRAEIIANSFVEHKAPRTDTNGSTFAASAPTTSPEVASVQAAVTQVQSEVVVVKQEVARLNSSDTKIDACCFTMNSKLDLLLEDTESVLDNLNVSVNLSTVEGKLDTLIDSSSVIESMLENLNVSVDISTLESKLDACCVTTNSKLDTVVAGTESILDNLENLTITTHVATLESKVDLLLDDVSVVESLIVESDACTARSLTHLDVSDNRIVISTPGNYCMAHDIGTLSSQVTVSLVVDNITLCLNNRELFGSVEVYGANTQIKNGTITVPAGATGVTVSSTANNAYISHLSIQCDSNGAGTALSIVASRCLVDSSVCVAGGIGGDAIALFGDDSVLKDLQIFSCSQGGGHGIACYNPASRIAIKKCTVDGKDSLLVPGFGSGIFIAPGCASIEIRGCTLARTANFAIEDNHEDDVNFYSSVIYNNFAYDSANSNATYQIRNKRSMGQSYGVDLISGSPGLYANVYVP